MFTVRYNVLQNVPLYNLLMLLLTPEFGTPLSPGIINMNIYHVVSQKYLINFWLITEIR